jgi:hypothetical protein
LVKALLADARKWLALIDLPSGSQHYDARTHTLLTAALELQGRLRRTLELCDYGPELLRNGAAIPVGIEGVIRIALFSIWRLCYDTEFVENRREELDWAIKALETHLTDVQQSPGLPAEGPNPPDSFCYGENEVEGLSLYQWRLLQALWGEGQPREAVPEADVIRHVYQGKGKSSDTHRALMELRRRTQRCLEAKNISLSIELDNGYLSLLPISPQRSRG